MAIDNILSILYTIGMVNELIASSQPLSYISDEVLGALANNLLQKAQAAADRDEKYIYKNVLDPFSAIFDAMRQGITLVQWLEQEKSRQIQKTLQNYVGDFHQSVIGSISGWENLKVGSSIDLRSREKKVIAEIKNKHNTMNSSSALATYDKLQRHLDYDESYQAFTAYCVVVIPKTPRVLNVPFHPSERGTPRPIREHIRMIDGKSFYELATGDPEALQKLYVRLAILLSNIQHMNSEVFVEGGTFEDLFRKAYTSR